MTNEQHIWEGLLQRIGNPYGTAAVMGNLMAESSLSPICVTGLSKTGYETVSQYVIASDDGVHDFSNDGVAFGLAQWYFHTRKQGLWEFAKKRCASVGDLETQLAYICQEMSIHYKTVWQAVTGATEIKAASDLVMLKYEKPANTGEAAKNRREYYAQKFFDSYATAVGPMVYITDKNVNMRVGNGMTYASASHAQKGDYYQWIATAKNGWHAIRVKSLNRVLWVHPDFSELRG